MPRPSEINVPDNFGDDDDHNPAALIENEVMRLLLHDSFKYPVKKSKKSSSRSFPIAVCMCSSVVGRFSRY